MMKIDESILQAISNEYQADDEDASYWHLYIGENEEDKAFFSIYDNAAGNPGVEGEIVSLTDSSLVIKVDQDMFEALPSSQWELSKDKLELTYELLEDGIRLTNHETAVIFKKEGACKTILCRWQSENPQSLRNISFENEQVYLEGWIGMSDGNWIEENVSFWMDPDCEFIDDCFEHSSIDQDAFLKLLDRKDAADTVIELDMVDDYLIVEIRLVPEEQTLQPN